jgi:hypothetical protein
MNAPHAQIANARPWRIWAKENSVGINTAQRAIAEGRLKVRRLGKRLLILPADGMRFLESLPEGPGPRPRNFMKD